MTSIHIDRRVTKLETRVTDVEEHYSESQLELTRRVTGLEIIGGQLIDGVNQLGRGMALILERLEIPSIEFPTLTRATEAEIGAALDADC
ncbi:hypothetical protein ACQPW1_06675 [Nocardia sp. CA-128927]|uniref:hypothetical protein n=1 Tax=Nocardia sp. CA-128927 TaxID=3239975 RepID=UPI003D99A4C5